MTLLMVSIAVPYSKTVIFLSAMQIDLTLRCTAVRYDFQFCLGGLVTHFAVSLCIRELRDVDSLKLCRFFGSTRSEDRRLTIFLESSKLLHKLTDGDQLNS